MSFFDSFPSFYHTGRIGSQPGRLNARYGALIAANIDAIHGKSILDIGSHDGRWSFAALKSGARNIIGVETDSDLVNNASDFLREQRFPQAQYSFRAGDALEEIAQVVPGMIDTVFLFGVLYCTSNQQLLLQQLARLRPTTILIDTFISAAEGALIELVFNPAARSTRHRVNTVPKLPFEILGHPSRRGLDLMLMQVGYRSTYFDWHAFVKEDWAALEDYQAGQRVTLRAELIR